jgi:ribokinase
VSAAAGRVVVVGSLNLDLILRVEELPAPGATTSSQSLDESTGGKGANQAVAAAAAGAPTRMVGAVGAHDAGPRILDDLTGRGIDVSGVLLLDGVATGRAVVTVDARGENSIVVSAGANGGLSSDAIECALADLGPSDVVVLQNEIPVAATTAAARAARARGARVVWNAAPAPAGRAEVLDGLDLLVVNEGELAAIARHLQVDGRSMVECVAAVRDAVGADVVCTRGAAGALFAIGGESGALPAPAVPVIDTTGAGDTFVGYLCAQWAMGGTETVVEQIELAIAAAALAVTRPGAAIAIPSRAAVEDCRDPLRGAWSEGKTG